MAMTRTSLSAVAIAIAGAGLLGLACAGGGSAGQPIQGAKRSALCEEVERPPPFRCPQGTNRRGKPPPDGTEMWCQRWDGTRHGSYRRFPPGAGTASEPDFVSDGAVVGEYREGEQHGAWWSRRAGARDVSVAIYQDGKLAQRVRCRL
jgi:hypothetical protein